MSVNCKIGGAPEECVLKVMRFYVDAIVVYLCSVVAFNVQRISVCVQVKLMSGTTS